MTEDFDVVASKTARKTQLELVKVHLSKFRLVSPIYEGNGGLNGHDSEAAAVK